MIIIHLRHVMASVYTLGKSDVQFEGSTVTETGQINAIAGDRRKLTSVFEIIGSLLAMVYAMSIALNIGAEMFGFSLLLVSRLNYSRHGPSLTGGGRSCCFRASM
jgi:hypothetical protein